MNFTTNKEKGNCGLAFAIAHYVSQGYTISIPMNDTQDYDLVIDKGGKLYKVQVKSTGSKSPYGIYVCSLRSCGGTNGACYKTVKDTNIDILFILTEDMDMYEIPFNEISQKSAINLGKEVEKFRIHNDCFQSQNTKEQTSSDSVGKYCKICGAKLSHSNTSGLCADCACKQRRIAERPEKDELLREVATTSFVQTGKLYGVSDKSIVKWCVSYGLPSKKKELVDLYNSTLS